MADMIRLGRHSLICGSSTDDRVIAQVQAAAPEIIITDPPYCAAETESSRRYGTIHVDIIGDRLSVRGYQSQLRYALMHYASVQYIYVFCSWRMWTYTVEVLEALALPVRHMIVWDKGYPGLGLGWRPQHELIAFASRSPLAEKRKGQPALGDVQRFNRITGARMHPTQKPVDLLLRLAEMTPGDTVFDPFLRSGSTLLAAEQAGKTCIGVEVSAAICDTVRSRWMAAHG